MYSNHNKQKAERKQLKYQIALTMLPMIGNVTAKNLVSYCGGVNDIFEASTKELLKVPGIGKKIIEPIRNHSIWMEKVEEELAFIEANNIQTLFYFDSNYPQRLKMCTDGPILLYYKGTADLNNPYTISIVGTRNATAYGKEICQKIIASLKAYKPLIISGLAYGIDYNAHKASVQEGVATVGVLGHGLDRIYPAQHQKLSEKMLQNGGVLSEFRSDTLPDRVNFPQRNRIIAGMTDATIVVETAKKGGSIITAYLANSYNRDVYAFPGRVNNPYSAGCNELIKRNIAALVESGEDIAAHLGWTLAEEATDSVQKQLFVELTNTEQQVVDVLQTAEMVNLDHIRSETRLPASKLAATILNLELKGLVKTLPGSQYKLL